MGEVGSGLFFLETTTTKGGRRAPRQQAFSAVLLGEVASDAWRIISIPSPSVDGMNLPKASWLSSVGQDFPTCHTT